MQQDKINELFGATAKTYFQGTHRSRLPAETLFLYKDFLPKMGITRLANVTGLDRIGLPVCVAIRPNSKSLAASQGKGDTLEAAMASAMMESIELWHAENLQLVSRYASHHELSRQYQTINIEYAPVKLDATFEKSRPLHWVEGYDIASGCHRWLPHDLVTMNLVKQPGQNAIFLESSSGLSSGNHIAEAAVHGLAEVIERDAMSLWELYSASERKARQVNPATITDAGLNQLLATLKSKGIEIGIWDATSDINVPVYTCMILEDPDSPLWRPIPAYMGHGCHLDPVIALSRAINEAIQSRLTAISGSRDDIFHADYVRAGNVDDHQRLISGLKQPAPQVEFRRPELAIGKTLQEDLHTLIQQLKKVDINEVVIVDLSQPTFNIPVVKVVVPALEPYYTAFYRPGFRAQKLAKELAA